eukprot:2826382-Ditylum_brightwellii.AAC.1
MGGPGSGAGTQLYPCDQQYPFRWGDFLASHTLFNDLDEFAVIFGEFLIAVECHSELRTELSICLY